MNALKMNPHPAPVDSSNVFAVGLSRNERVVINCPVVRNMDRATALNLAAWIRVIADPGGQEFERLVEEIEGKYKKNLKNNLWK